jgi:hypothetical protein
MMSQAEIEQLLRERLPALPPDQIAELARQLVLAGSTDVSGSQGFVNQPSGPVSQVYGTQRDIATHGGSYSERDINTIIQIVLGTGDQREAPGLAELLRLAQSVFAINRVPIDQLRSLGEMLSQIGLPADVVMHAFRSSAHRLWPLPEAQNTTDLLQRTLLALADAAPWKPSGVPPLVEFVELLAAAVPQPDAQALLRSWSEMTAQQHGMSHARLEELRHTLRAPAAPTELDPSLLIAIRPTAADQERYHVEAWLWRKKDDILCLQEDQESHTAESLPLLLNDLHRRSRAYIRGAADRLSIEFFLPRELLCLRVHDWLLDIGLGVNIPVGEHYSVVVRAYERLLPEYMQLLWPLWHAKWRQFQELAHSAWPDAIFMPKRTDDYHQRRLHAHLMAKHRVCLVLTLTPQADSLYQDIFATMIA